MLPGFIRAIYYRFFSITIVLGAMVMLLLFSACSGREKALGKAITERDSLPVLNTRGVASLISDSGVTRYRIHTEEWLVFDRKEPPYWAFEKGVYLEKFDSVFQVEASIKADTAYYYNKDELWKLMGHVDIKNLKGERFSTELLYWNQREQKIYSDRFIRIEQPDRIITGRGFDSNQQMTVYKIHQPEGVFYIDEEALAGDSLQTDSLNR
ncbi:LPS export ABC transporter periplasmic protein LptC [Bacteroides zoogleoformans]|uniref:LPS export ABC transporter periplasmic protein LptC n=1 Tax=Bacteroides zoogleoformans TaxID=28119 RepID=UPI00248F26B1|nr:LPS export ABC transporter periplasmic protein LptC [Bacteroides zoogleoformans]